MPIEYFYLITWKSALFQNFGSLSFFRFKFRIDIRFNPLDAIIKNSSRPRVFILFYLVYNFTAPLGTESPMIVFLE
jgi:hypothetical protein